MEALLRAVTKEAARAKKAATSGHDALQGQYSGRWSEGAGVECCVGVKQAVGSAEGVENRSPSRRRRAIGRCARATCWAGSEALLRDERTVRYLGAHILAAPPAGPVAVAAPAAAAQLGHAGRAAARACDGGHEPAARG